MSLRISSWAIRRPLLPFIILIGLIIAGALEYFKLPINNLPNVEIPIVNVSVVLPGATPTEIEAQITRRIEATVAGIDNIKHITSTITDSISSTQIEFQLGTDIDQALSKTRDQITVIRPLLPHGSEEPVIQRVDTDLSPILTFTADSHQRSLEETSWFVDSQVMSSLLAIKGVAKVQRQGGLSREVHIEVDPAKLQIYGITVELINNQLRQTALTLPAGRINDGIRETLIRTVGSPQDVETLSNMKIALPNGRSARLKDLGIVRDTSNETRQLARLNHQPVVAFAIYRSRLASEVNIELGVNKALHDLKIANPDIKFSRIQSQVEYTKESYHSALWSFLEGTLLAAIVVFLFLRTWRATWIAGLVIPLSVIPTFIVMQWLGFSLNIVTLLALSLVSGILVDDAIVEIENITRHMKMGKSPYQAAIDAADEIGLVVLATSAVIVAVFVPVSFMGGIVGQYFTQFGITVAVATIFSLLVARLITPVLAAYFLKPIINMNTQSNAEVTPKWMEKYLKALEKALIHRKSMVLFGAVIVISSFAIGAWLPTDFMPTEDKSQSMLQVQLPPGSRLADTDIATRALSDILLRQPEVKSVYALIGGADSETNIDGEIRQATLSIQLQPRHQRSLGIQSFEQLMLKKLSVVPNIRIGFLNEDGNKAVNISLTSDNPELLQHTANKLEQELRDIKQLSNISSTSPLPRTELKITPRNGDAARLGVSTESISDTIRIATMGDQSMNLTRINVNGRQIPVRVLLNTHSEDDPAIINHLLIPSNTDQMIPLAAVADVALSAGATSIARFDQKRQIMLEADLNDATLGEALNAIDQLPTMKNLPAGVTRFDSGNAELLSDMFDSFSMAIIAGVLIVFAVLVLLFRTLLQPITIMLALPLSIGGALLALLLSQSALSLPAVIGILMLMGIVGKNGILLIDFMIEHRSAGMTRHEAIVEACKQRARPIIMTTLAMIAGMLPVIFGLGAGTEFRTPMALTVIGGLITSTGLSLLFIPVIYIFIDDFECWLAPKLKSFTTVETTN